MAVFNTELIYETKFYLMLYMFLHIEQKFYNYKSKIYKIFKRFSISNYYVCCNLIRLYRFNHTVESEAGQRDSMTVASLSII